MHSDTTTRNVLVIANETAPSAQLRDVVRAATHDRLDASVLVVAPALNTRLRHWATDDAASVEEARERLRRCLRDLARDGIHAEAMIGDPDPFQAVADALAVFSADAIVIATHPESRSNWLAKDLVERVRRTSDLEVFHLTVVGADERAKRIGLRRPSRSPVSRLGRRPAHGTTPAH